eukprot:gnl/TRDRNA2_/TRDRNA2_149072_c0_seq1.p1 gnl/TRDRNA2_/TRDRNA2_149072_c0~~gnl/TRDRNA2_/TRDRNA2_149072_c0_seq1.p1  ORF type:complete len:193 (-),score=22.83 gnl/TRDRNA2_/TRDRNA2_149072_c0_seq1:477-1013(-)
MGDLPVVVAPVLRFSDVGFGADVRIEQLGDPEKLINGFGPEITGDTVEDHVDSMSTRKADGLTFYDYELSGISRRLPGPLLVTMTAAKNRLYICIAKPKVPSRWAEEQSTFRTMVDSFRVTSTSPAALSALKPQYIVVPYIVPSVFALALFTITLVSRTKLLSCQQLVQGLQEPLLRV